MYKREMEKDNGKVTWQRFFIDAEENSDTRQGETSLYLIRKLARSQQLGFQESKRS